AGTLATLIPLLPPSDQQAVTNEALALARDADDSRALVAVADLLPERAKDEVLREAWDRATATEDPQSRFDQLLTLWRTPPAADSGLLPDVLLEAAHAIGSPADRARELIQLVKALDALSEEQRSDIVSDAWAAMEEIDELDEERREILVELADLCPETRMSEATRALLQAAATAEVGDYYSRAD